MTSTISRLKRVGASRNSFATTRCYRIVRIKAETRPTPPPTHYPTTSAMPSSRSAPTVRTNLSQAGFEDAIGYSITQPYWAGAEHRSARTPSTVLSPAAACE